MNPIRVIQVGERVFEETTPGQFYQASPPQPSFKFDPTHVEGIQSVMRRLNEVGTEIPKIPMIKMIRALTGLGLLEAKILFEFSLNTLYR